MRWLVTGASGQLGSYLLREAAAQELNVLAWSGSETGRILGFDLQPVDLGQPEQVRSAFQAARPGVIIHAAALASVAACRDDPQRAHAVNAQGSALLARLAAETEARFVHVSTDMVFDGERGGYREQDRPSPLSGNQVLRYGFGADAVSPGQVGEGRGRRTARISRARQD